MIVAAPSLSLGRIPGRGAPPIPFAPTDLSNLRLWVDAREGVLNSVGNYFTDETASIDLTGFAPVGDGVDPNNNYFVLGQVNGRNSYRSQLEGGDFGGQGNIIWNTSNWQLEMEDYGEEGSGYSVPYTATGNTTYPWQATWAGGTVTRTATTVDVPATNNQTVAKWTNKVAGSPSMDQTIASAQPLFRDLGGGNRFISFNSDSLFASQIAPGGWGSSWSYYVVSTPMTAVGQSTNTPRYVLGHTGGPPSSRGGFGSTSTELAIKNGSTVLFTTPAVSSGLSSPNTTYVFSARVSSSGFTLGNNSTFQYRAVAISSSSENRLYLGTLAGAFADFIVSGNIKEVLAYKQAHTDQEANLVVGYLAQKWGVTL